MLVVEGTTPDIAWRGKTLPEGGTCKTFPSIAEQTVVDTQVVHNEMLSVNHASHAHRQICPAASQDRSVEAFAANICHSLVVTHLYARWT